MKSFNFGPTHVRTYRMWNVVAILINMGVGIGAVWISSVQHWIATWCDPKLIPQESLAGGILVYRPKLLLWLQEIKWNAHQKMMAIFFVELRLAAISFGDFAHHVAKPFMCYIYI